MLDIPELEKFDTAIYSHSWLDKNTGELMAWSRGEYDDFRRKHHDRKLPTSIEVLNYFGYSLDRFGWMQLMTKRYNLFAPERKTTNSEWGREMRRSHKELSGDDEKIGDSSLGGATISGWEDQIHIIVDDNLGSDATSEVIDALLARPVPI